MKSFMQKISNFSKNGLFLSKIQHNKTNLKKTPYETYNH